MSAHAPNERSLAARKREIRRALRQRLAGLSAQERQTRSQAIADLTATTPEWQRARTVMLYLSLPDEVQTGSLLQRALDEGKRLAVPRIVDAAACEMLPVPILSLAEGELEQAHYGVHVPRGSREPVAIDEIDLAVVPGLGFSRKGQRIGRGLGYYDRFLSHRELRAPVCGLAFEAQVVDELPGDERDRPVGLIVSEREVLRF